MTGSIVLFEKAIKQSIHREVHSNEKTVSYTFFRERVAV